jgi:hypothetical protein
LALFASVDGRLLRNYAAPAVVQLHDIICPPRLSAPVVCPMHRHNRVLASELPGDVSLAIHGVLRWALPPVPGAPPGMHNRKGAVKTATLRRRIRTDCSSATIAPPSPPGGLYFATRSTPIRLNFAPESRIRANPGAVPSRRYVLARRRRSFRTDESA